MWPCEDGDEVLGVWRSARNCRHGLESGEKGLMETRKEVMAESGRGILFV